MKIFNFKRHFRRAYFTTEELNFTDFTNKTLAYPLFTFSNFTYLSNLHLLVIVGIVYNMQLVDYYCRISLNGQAKREDSDKEAWLRTHSKRKYSRDVYKRQLFSWLK